MDKKILGDFIATYQDVGDVGKALSYFPELKSYDTSLLGDLIATYNDVQDLDETVTYFPEFEEVQVSIEDEVAEKRKGRQEQESAKAAKLEIQKNIIPLEIAEYMSKEFNDYGIGYEYRGEQTLQEFKDNNSEQTAKDLNVMKGEDSTERDNYANYLNKELKKSNEKNVSDLERKKVINATQLTPEDFKQSEEDFVEIMNKKYGDKGFKFEVTDSWIPGDKVTMTYPDGNTEEIELATTFNFARNPLSVSDADNRFGKLKTSIDKYIQGPDADLSDEEAIMKGRHPEMNDGKSINEQTTNYIDNINKIKNSTLSDEQKWNNISNLAKPAYSTLQFNPQTNDYEFVIKPEFQQSINEKFSEVNPTKYKNQAEFVADIKKTRDQILSDDPVVMAQATAIQQKLAPDFKTLAESISSKYDMTDEAQVEAANKEYEKAANDLFRKELSASPVYRRVVEDLDKAIDNTANTKDMQFKRFNTEGLSGMFLRGNDVMKYLARGTFAEDFVDDAVDVLEAGTVGFGAQTGKAWNASQIGIQQMSMKKVAESEDELNALSSRPGGLSDDKEIYVYAGNNGIDFEKSGLERPASISQVSSGEMSRQPKYNLDGTIETKKQNVYGGDLKTEKMTVGEYKKMLQGKKDRFKDKIAQDVAELNAFDKVLELMPQPDFEDGIGVKDALLVTAQTLPQVAISAGGMALAPATGGTSAVLSTGFMFMQEFGNNYWDAITVGLSEELGREPTNEEIVDAIASDKYQDQGTAAGWGAISAGLEFVTGAGTVKRLKGVGDTIKKGNNTTKKIFDKIAKNSGYNGMKDMFVRDGQNVMKDMIKSMPKQLLKNGKAGVQEYFTEYAQELTGQAALGQALDGDALSRIDRKSAEQAGTGGGIVGFLLPGVGGMYRGGRTAIRRGAQQASIGLNLKNSAQAAQANKFYVDANSALELQYKNGQITKQELQQEKEFLADTRNASLKIPSNFSPEGRQESLELLRERRKLEQEIADSDNVFVDEQKARVLQIDNRLKSINKIEQAFAGVQKASKGANIPVNIVRAKDSGDVTNTLNSLNPGNKTKNAKIARNKLGIHVSKDPKTGKSTIILNEDQIAKTNKWTTAQHELLHEVLTETLKLNPRSVFALEEAVYNKLGNLDPKQFQDSNLRKRLQQYQKAKGMGKAVKAEETLTLFSEALASGDIKFDRGFFERANDLIRRTFQTIAPNSKLGSIKFETAEDVYKFMKDYNKSVKKGKFTRAQKKAIGEGVEVATELIDAAKKPTSKTQVQKDQKTLEEQETKPSIIDEGEFDSTFDPTQEDELDILAREFEGLDVIEEVEDADIENIETDLEADESTLVEDFRPLAQSIANQYRTNAKYNQNKDILVDEILTNERGVLGLIRTYKNKVADGTIQKIDAKTLAKIKKTDPNTDLKVGDPITLGMFVNNRTGGIRQRSKQIAAEVLGFAKPKTGPKTSPIGEARVEGQSLRRSLGLFGKGELDTMLQNREITKQEYDSLLQRSNMVIPSGKNKGKTYGEVIDGIYNKATDAVKRGVILRPKQVTDFIVQEFRRQQFVDDIKSLLGKPASQEYKNFLDEYGEAIYNKLSQRQVNKRFKEFKQPVIDQRTGQQKRMTVGESKAIGSQAKDKQGGNKVFIKKPYDKTEFTEYHTNPKSGRPASKQTALAEAISEIIGLDATQQILNDKEVLQDLEARDVTDVQLETIKEGITDSTARGVDFKFSIDETIEIPDTFNQEHADQLEALLEFAVQENASIEELQAYAEMLDQDLQDWLGKNEVLQELFSDGTTGFKKPLLAENWGPFESIKQKYIDNITNKNNEVAMEELAVSVDNMIEILPPIILKYLPPNLLGLISGGRLLDIAAIREDSNYRYLYDKYNNKANSIKDEAKALKEFKKEYGFDPSKVEILNANMGLMKDIQDILSQDISAKRKEVLVEEEYGDKIRGLNENNPKMYKFLANEFAKASAKNPNVFLGLVRLLEGNTNNTQGLRGLTKLTLIEFDDRSQAPYFDPNNGKYAFTEGDAKKRNIPINKQHYLYKEAVKITDEIMSDWLGNQVQTGKEITDQEIADKYDKLLASRLRFKGEHVDPQANVSRNVAKAIAEYAADLESGMPEAAAMSILNNKLDNLLNNYDQTLAAELMSYMQDKELGTTSALAFLRNYSVPKKYANKLKTPEGLSLKEFTDRKIQETGRLTSLRKQQEQARNENVLELKASKVLEVDDNMDMDAVLSKAATIDEALRMARRNDPTIKKIRVFDFDDTIATSKNKVFATKGDERIELNAEEFAKDGERLLSEGYKFDFSDFNRVTEGGRGPLFDIAKKIRDARGNEDLFILTARAPEAQTAIYEFLKSQGLEFKKENIIGLGNSTPEAKANWIIEKAADGYNDFYFADDAIKNVKAVRDALDVIDVKSQVQQAKIKASLDEDFNGILEESTGVGVDQRFSKARAQVVGEKKGRFKFFIPPSAEDFTGLIYGMLAKGKKGERQFQWFKKNLLDPYSRAMNNISTARLNLMQDFKALKKTLEVPKVLTKTNQTGFTNEQAVRVYLWDRNGYNIPGMSQRDVQDLVNVVENNPELNEFANKLEQINKELYPKPGQDWLAGTITTDLIEGLNTTKREKYLEQWNENVSEIFSEENLNKIEALYGPKFRESLENMLTRMKTGKNRTTSNNRLTNRILNYINGSNAAIMFLNTRSAILQTISAVNFINFSFNNPLKAGQAFANQPQYWKDFMTLMNSDFLRDRRQGQRIDISASEIADQAKTAKNKAKAAIAYMMEKGYLPTQYADSFAIASGGATFYRNRIKNLMKNDPNMTEKQASEIAMNEFRELAEASQQSSRPDKISQQQASDLGRLVLMFGNTPMQYARLQKRAFQDLVAGRGDAKVHMAKIAYYGFIQNMLFNGLQQALFAVGFGDESEEDEKKLSNTVNGMLDSTLRGLGLGGVAVSVVKNFLLDIYERSGRTRPEYVDSAWKILQFSPPIGSKIAKIRQALYLFNSKKRRQEMIDKGFSLDNPAYEAGAKVISATANLPLDRVLYKYENIKDALNEENEWWETAAMLGGWAKWQLEPQQKPTKKSTKKKKKKSSIKSTGIKPLKIKPIKIKP